jgi:hypothetical protein
VNVDASVTTALATLLGATIGGLTSVLATLFTQRTQARTQWFEQDARRRRDLYKEFIETAARCYVHALQNEEADIPASSISMERLTGCASCLRPRSST